jgi:hypothetical protein
MQVSIQNRSVLYGQQGAELVPEGLYEAALIDVRPFANVHGQRLGLVFEITAGLYRGLELMESAAVTGSPRGKLAEMVRGLGGAEASIEAARNLIGRHCRIAVRHESNKAGKTYAAVAQTFT